MPANDAELRRYFRQIRSWLPCTRKLKQQIMELIEARVRDFLEQNPDADFARLQVEFGNPQTIAAAYVENTGTAEILKSLRVRRQIIAIITVAAAIFLLSWAVAVTWAIIDLSNTTDAPYVEMTIE